MDWLIVVVFSIYLIANLWHVRLTLMRGQWSWMTLFAVLSLLNIGVLIAVVN